MGPSTTIPGLHLRILEAMTRITPKEDELPKDGHCGGTDVGGPT